MLTDGTQNHHGDRTDREPASPKIDSNLPRVPLAVRVFRPVARAWLWAGGWRIEGALPDIAKYVVVAAPHTTNWDLPHALSAGLVWGRRVHWMGKHTLFRWPFGGVMRWLGGVAIDRTKANNAVEQMVAWFSRQDRLVLVIPPSGTRSASVKWKTGFYHIAVGARVPIVLCFIDYRRRVIGVAKIFDPSGDFDTDMAAIQAVYDPIQAWARP